MEVGQGMTASLFIEGTRLCTFKLHTCVLISRTDCPRHFHYSDRNSCLHVTCVPVCLQVLLYKQSSNFITNTNCVVNEAVFGITRSVQLQLLFVCLFVSRN